jgi:hypothetical protein
MYFQFPKLILGFGHGGCGGETGSHHMVQADLELLCYPGWPQTLDLPDLAFQVLELQAGATMSNSHLVIFDTVLHLAHVYSFLLNTHHILCSWKFCYFCYSKSL